MGKVQCACCHHLFDPLDPDDGMFGNDGHYLCWECFDWRMVYGTDKE